MEPSFIEVKIFAASNFARTSARWIYRYFQSNYISTQCLKGSTDDFVESNEPLYKQVK